MDRTTTSSRAHVDAVEDAHRRARMQLNMRHVTEARRLAFNDAVAILESFPNTEHLVQQLIQERDA